MSNMKQKVISGLIWRYGERMCAQGVSFIVGIILARLLSPDDYGVLALLTVFITITNTVVTGGFATALIQKKNADGKDFSTVFYFNGIVSLIAYVILFFAAPFISNFYNSPMMIPAFRVLSLSVIIGAVNTIQHAYVQKTMRFKNFFVSTLVGTIVSAVVGISMAYAGFGVWALITQYLTSLLINTVVLWFTAKWRPILAFSFERLKGLFGFGSKMLCTSIIDTVYKNMYSLVIGKYYDAQSVGFYNRGKQWPNLIISNIDGSINQVLLPAYSQIQDNKKALKTMMRRAITLSTYLIFPAMVGLAAVARPLTIIAIGEKWLPSVPYIQFCCFTFALWPIHTANLQAIKAVGRSDLFLKLEIIKKAIGIATLVATIPFGLYAMMVGRCIDSVISSFLNASPNKKLFNYSYFEQIKDLLPTIIISLIMGAVVWALSLININLFLLLVIQVLVGVVIYFGLSYLFKLEAFLYLLRYFKQIISKNK